jgi:hypothetical protein
MKRLIIDLFYILISVLAALAFIPFTLILSLYAAFKAYRDYLSRCMITMQIRGKI